MPDMFGLALLATLAWVLALVYYNRCHPLHEQEKNTIGFKYACQILVQFALMIYLFRLLSGSGDDNPDSSNAAAANVLSPIQWGIIALLGLLLWIAFAAESFKISDFFLKNHQTARITVRGSLIIILTALMLTKIFTDLYVFHNILLFFAVTIALVFAVSLTRVGAITLFLAIMLLDIYLVWMANSAPGDDSKTSWYVSMIMSPFMQHFPFPLGFRWEHRLLGNGDIFFMCLTVMYAKRVWSNTAAVIAGILVTLPLLLLPLASYVLSSPPPAWPYTIFISPIALFIAIYRKAN